MQNLLDQTQETTRKRNSPLPEREPYVSGKAQKLSAQPQEEISPPASDMKE